MAWRSSRFSRSSALSRSETSDGTPDRLPLSISAVLTHSCNVCGVQPIFDEIETTAAQREACSSSCSRTIRTARVRTSGENLLILGRFGSIPTLEQRWIVLVHLDELDQALNSEVGERQDPVFSDTIDPDDIVFDFQYPT